MNLGYALSLNMERGADCPIGTEMLQAGIKLVLEAQAPDGIWPASGAMFPAESRGTVYVFAPEMLSLLFDRLTIRQNLHVDLYDSFDRLVSWIEQNERRSEKFGDGWVSNHLPFRSKTESWSTASVFGVLREMERICRATITGEVVNEFRGTVYRSANPTKFDGLMDSTVQMKGGGEQSLKEIFRYYFINPRISDTASRANRPRKSAILFGPPGTAKTSYADAIAQALGWPLISLRIGNFLTKGWQQTSAQADEIFAKLVEAENVVVLFDEIEELVLERQDAPEAQNRALTATMLPLFQDLYNRGQGIYLVATNFRERFDKAVTRPGRFDLIVSVMPPSVQAKQRFLENELRSAGVSDIAGVAEFMSQRNETVLRALTFFEWREFCALVVSRVSEPDQAPMEIGTLCGEILEDRFQDPLIEVDSLEKYDGISTIF